MKTSKELVVDNKVMYECELSECPTCKSQLEKCNYRSGRKVVQSLHEVLAVSYQPYRCVNPECANYDSRIRSARWLQLAPLHCTYAFDVIAQIGWSRQSGRMPFLDIHAQLSQQVQLSESQVRHLYYQRYLPLLACHERLSMPLLSEVATKSGLLLTLDGLAPEGGEPQLWVVRELQTGLTLRCGWLSRQTQVAFENFLQPIADLNLPIQAILSDKQKGLPAAVANVFDHKPHAFCQSHYLKNLAEPIADLDQQLKVTMRKTVRKQVGKLIRQEDVESPGVLTMTGLIPSPIELVPPRAVEVQIEGEFQVQKSVQTGSLSQSESHAQTQIENYGENETTHEVETKAIATSGSGTQTQLPAIVTTRLQTDKTDSAILVEVQTDNVILVEVQSDLPNRASDEVQSTAQDGSAVYEFESESLKTSAKERDEIIADLNRRVRYLLTLKGRPPFRLAGLEMFKRLSEVVGCIEVMINHAADSRLVELSDGIKAGIDKVKDQMQELSVAAGWLKNISDLLDPEGKAPRTAAEVHQQLFDYLSTIRAGLHPESLDQIAKQLEKTTVNYSAGLFVSYDIVGLPRTNNERESEFRLLISRILRTTGQKGATIRLIQQVGAWELIPRPSSFNETVTCLSQVDHVEFQKERERLRAHRARFKCHARSEKRSSQLLNSFAERWLNT